MSLEEINIGSLETQKWLGKQRKTREKQKHWLFKLVFGDLEEDDLTAFERAIKRGHDDLVIEIMNTSKKWNKQGHLLSKFLHNISKYFKFLRGNASDLIYKEFLSFLKTSFALDSSEGNNTGISQEGHKIERLKYEIASEMLKSYTCSVTPEITSDEEEYPDDVSSSGLGFAGEQEENSFIEDE